METTFSIFNIFHKFENCIHFQRSQAVRPREPSKHFQFIKCRSVGRKKLRFSAIFGPQPKISGYGTDFQSHFHSYS